MATAYDDRPGASRAGEHHRSRVPALLRAPFEGRTWRELLYAVTGLPVAIFAFAYAVIPLSLGAGLLVTFLGIPVLALGLAGCRVIGRVERARARALLGVRVGEPAPVRVTQRRKGPLGIIGALLRDGVSWRHLLYSVLYFPWALVVFCFAVVFWSCGLGLLSYPMWRWALPGDEPGIQLWNDANGEPRYMLDNPSELAVVSATGLVFVLLTPWLVRGLTQVDGLLVRGLLGPSSLATRVSELEADRGVVVDTAAADLRRIERDLHDGAQARLVTLAMDLGLAKEKLLEDPEAAAKMVDEAHGEVKLALQELRDLARGIHPAILTDRGLGPALSSLAARCTVPVTVTADLEERPARAIEGIAYFTVSELLQNISKHSHATRATIDIWRSDTRLFLQVTDDGRGGADTT
ncbi:sensor domain-containing protein, partial [Streptomyces daliensis]|nr:sensor domain-containing protein [Streptomyces daliensis]